MIGEASLFIFFVYKYNNFKVKLYSHGQLKVLVCVASAERKLKHQRLFVIFKFFFELLNWWKFFKNIECLTCFLIKIDKI